MSDCHWTAMGRLFGYPECCITDFMRRVRGDMTFQEMKEENASFHGKPWGNTGFIPCRTCRPDAEKDFVAFVAERITPNRKYDKPFPEDDYT